MKTEFYRQSSDEVCEAFSKWKRDCPFETPHTVSFFAGWNAALRFMEKASELIKLKLTDNGGNVSYLEIENGKISYYTKGLTPLALANISDNAAELSFELKGCRTSAQAVAAVKIRANYVKKVEIL